MIRSTFILALGALLTACFDKGSEKFAGESPASVATYGSCAFCHEGLASRMAGLGGHGTTALKCQACHAEQMPGNVGPQHRSTAACAHCHPVQQNHTGTGAGECIEQRQCTGCHTPHGSTNLALVRTRIQTRDCDLQPITFTKRDGRVDGSFASLTAPGTGVCEICHSSTRYYRRDGSAAPHFTTTCSAAACHSHARGFVPLIPTPTATPSPTSSPSPTATVPPESTPTPTEVPITQLNALLVGAAPTGIDDPIWDGIAPFRPRLADASTGRLYGDGRLNMTGTFDGLVGFNGGTDVDLKLRAVHDGTSLYILAEWNDARFDLDRDRWLYNGPADPLKPQEFAVGWTSQRNEDRIAFAFEIDTASSGFGTFASVGCAAACHDAGSGLEMRPQSGSVDLWQWRAALTAPLGHASDELTDAASGRRSDSGTPSAVRNAVAPNNHRSGPALEWNGSAQIFNRPDGTEVSLDPAFFLLAGHTLAFAGDAGAGAATYRTGCAACHGSAGQGGIGGPLDQPAQARQSRSRLEEAIATPSHPGSAAYNNLPATGRTDLLAFVRGLAGVPGYALAQPRGSAADVTAQVNAVYELVDSRQRTAYRVLLSRRLDTGNADDARFQPGNSYPFGVALMDNDGLNHIGSLRALLSLEK